MLAVIIIFSIRPPRSVQGEEVCHDTRRKCSQNYHTQNVIFKIGTTHCVFRTLQTHQEPKNIKYFDKYKVCEAKSFLLPAQQHIYNFQATYSKSLSHLRRKEVFNLILFLHQSIVRKHPTHRNTSWWNLKDEKITSEPKYNFKKYDVWLKYIFYFP